VDIDRALEVAQNTGGWSFEEADLMARALFVMREDIATLLKAYYGEAPTETWEVAFAAARLREAVEDARTEAAS
jgi:hypothetical protein